LCPTYFFGSFSKKAYQREAVYVYEAPVRLWHWVNAGAITVLAITGYFIGSPLPSMSGEASDFYVMGYIRFFHFVAAYIFAIGLLGRIYWAFVGNGHAKQLFLPPLFNKIWWQEVYHELRWYAFLEKEPKKYVGHNPMASLFMFFMFQPSCKYIIPPRIHSLTFSIQCKTSKYHMWLSFL
jgi:Ni/Fe-hydrogenase 1 B-type cytochrome subunit